MDQSPISFNEDGHNWSTSTSSVQPRAASAGSQLFPPRIDTGSEALDVCGAVYSGPSGALLHSLTAKTAWFAAGTLIATLLGDVPIEKLRMGDPIIVLNDKDRIDLGLPHGHSAMENTSAVTSVGLRQVDCRHHPHPADVWPIRVAPGAFGPGMPRRELELSPGHAVYLPDGGSFADGALIPLRYLVNGVTITQRTVDSIAYFNLELASHDVVFAEGLPSEASRNPLASNPCAAVIQSGPRLMAARERLRMIANSLGHIMTADHDMHLMVDGRRVDALRRKQTYMFCLPENARCIWLASRNAVSAEINDGPPDTRRLGVAVDRVIVDGNPLELTPGRGWHQREVRHVWTDGAGALLVPGARRIDVTLASSGRYWSPEATPIHGCNRIRGRRRGRMAELSQTTLHPTAA